MAAFTAAATAGVSTTAVASFDRKMVTTVPTEPSKECRPQPLVTIEDSRHSGRIGHCVGGRVRNAQSEPFDVTVKLLRQTERSFQCRAHEIMLFDGNKNGSETHDDLPLGFVARRACSYRYCSDRSKRSFIASLSVSSCGMQSDTARQPAFCFPAEVFATPVIPSLLGSGARVARGAVQACRPIYPKAVWSG